MKVDLTKEEIEGCMDALSDYPAKDQAQRDAYAKLKLVLSQTDETPSPASYEWCIKLEERLDALEKRLSDHIYLAHQ